MHFDAEAVLANVRRASDEDLLERCTVFRDGMEPEALEIIEVELASRGIGAGDIESYARRRPPALRRRGLPVKCSWCERGAVGETWGWHRLLGLLPIFPRRFHHCPDHAASGQGGDRPRSGKRHEKEG